MIAGTEPGWNQVCAHTSTQLRKRTVEPGRGASRRPLRGRTATLRPTGCRVWPTGLAGRRQLGDRRFDADVAFRLGRALRGPRDEIPSRGNTHALTLRTSRIPACLEWGVVAPLQRDQTGRCRGGLDSGMVPAGPPDDRERAADRRPPAPRARRARRLDGRDEALRREADGAPDERTPARERHGHGRVVLDAGAAHREPPAARNRAQRQHRTPCCGAEDERLEMGACGHLGHLRRQTMAARTHAPVSGNPTWLDYHRGILADSGRRKACAARKTSHEAGMSDL